MMHGASPEFGESKVRCWYLWLTIAALVLAVVAAMMLDTMPRRYAALLPGWQYVLWAGAAQSASALLVVAFAGWVRDMWRDPSRGGRYAAFMAVAFSAFLLSHLGSASLAHVVVTDARAGTIVPDILLPAVQAPIAAALFAGPFLVFGRLMASLAKSMASSSNLAFFALGILLLMYVYYWAHLEAASLMLSMNWAAATFTVGFLPGKGAVVVMFVYALARVAPRARASRAGPA